MAKLFDMDNPVWRLMGRIADFFLLTMFWLLHSIPVVTIGAATSALYYVMLRLSENQEGPLWRSYREAFRSNFKQPTFVWLIEAVFGIFFGVDLYFYYHLEGSVGTMLFWIFLFMTIVYLFVTTMVFPLSARLDTDLKNLYFMSFMTAFKNFSWVLFMIVLTVCVLAFGVFVFWPVLLLAPGIITWAHAMILNKMIFPKYGWEIKDEV